MIRASTEGTEDDTLLGMLRRNNASHFVIAAKLALECNGGYSYLLERGLYVRYRHAFGFDALAELNRKRRALALCFMAAMVEVGDA